MSDPRLICVACEQAEVTVLQPLCPACIALAGQLGLVDADDQDAGPKVQIGPTDI